MNESDLHTLTARIALHARQRPDQAVIICEDRRMTYAELNRESNRTANALLAAGLARGGRVAYLGRESEHYYDIALGCAKSGAVLVPINWRLTAPEIDHILGESQAELLFVEQEFAPAVERARTRLPTLRSIIQLDSDEGRAAGFLAWKAALPDTDPGIHAGTDDPVAQMYTSGTTGLPKGVVLAHRTFFTFIDNMTRHGVDWIDWLPEDRSLSCFPGLHAGGYAWFMHCLNVGATSVIMRTFVPDEAVRLVKDLGVTTIWAAPAMLQMMLAERSATPESFRSLRKVVYGGSPISHELMAQCMAGLGDCELVQAYAAAETGSFITCLPAFEHVPGNPRLTSAGRVCPGNEVKILGDDGVPQPPGRVGRICVRTPAHFVEYWRRPDATAQLLKDGWLHMSDAGYLDEDGYLFLRDRINDTIIVAGQNIYPVEVENALAEHPAVADVAVIGVDHPRWGQVAKAVVVLRPGESATGRELMVFLRGRIADFKIPTNYAFADGLPRNPTGKILRRLLREEAQAQPQDA
jgi:acyl-CoA synthetase (AMP-forming)/AMP-acid ligase II